MDVVLDQIPSRWIAAVAGQVRPGQAAAWKPALDQVWSLLRGRPDLVAGRNLFLYRRGGGPGDPIEAEFGVEVAQVFEPLGAVRAVWVPGGSAATVRTLDYAQLPAAHAALAAWMRNREERFSGVSFEIYDHIRPGSPSGVLVAHMLDEKANPPPGGTGGEP